MTRPSTDSQSDARHAPRLEVAIVVPCKGRIEHLRESVPRLLRQRTQVEYLIVVVDYGDPDNCFEWVARQKHPRLAAIRVENDVEEFNLSRARNCGACAFTSRLIGFADADALFDPRWLESAIKPIQSGGATATIPDWPWPEPDVLPACGISVVTASVFHQVRGFDEAFRGWGHEDKDYIGRVRSVGGLGFFDAGLFELIPHDAALRVAHYGNKHRSRSNFGNKARAAGRRGSVNPDGYGAGKIESFYCGNGASAMAGD
ncbi:MAG: GT2 family glycosyltransferase [Candidatus Binatia bacterium]|jgi:GT2 family glycosyltransferase